MYVMFPRRDGPINLIIVANPSTCVSLSASMCATDVCPCVCVCKHVCTCVYQIMQPAYTKSESWEDENLTRVMFFFVKSTLNNKKRLHGSCNCMQIHTVGEWSLLGSQRVTVKTT